MAIKILSVDDEQDLEALLTQYFRRKIRKGEYEFSFAHNGLEALRMMLDHPDFDIILSDINMPEMDGLTLLTKINEMRNPALKCIIVSVLTGYGEYSYRHEPWCFRLRYQADRYGGSGTYDREGGRADFFLSRRPKRNIFS